MPDIGCRCITVEKDKYELEVFECLECGFHLGLDGSWLEQVQDATSSEVHISCINCCNRWIIKTGEDSNEV